MVQKLKIKYLGKTQFPSTENRERESKRGFICVAIDSIVGVMRRSLLAFRSGMDSQTLDYERKRK